MTDAVLNPAIHRQDRGRDYRPPEPGNFLYQHWKWVLRNPDIGIHDTEPFTRCPLESSIMICTETPGQRIPDDYQRIFKIRCAERQIFGDIQRQKNLGRCWFQQEREILQNLSNQLPLSVANDGNGNHHRLENHAPIGSGFPVCSSGSCEMADSRRTNHAYGTA